MALLVYVDDLVFTNDGDSYISFKAYLHSCFNIKDLGPLKYLLEIKVVRNSQGLFLSQRKYNLEIIEECDITYMLDILL